MEEKQTFSFKLKKELLEKNMPDEIELITSEFLGYYISENMNDLGNGRYEFRTNNEYNLEYFNRLLELLELEYKAFSQDRLFISEVNLSNEVDGLMQRLDKYIFSQASFLKGLFLGAGHISITGNNYHLSFRIRNIFEKDKNIEMFNYVFKEKNLDYKILEYKKRNKTHIYFKRGEDLSNIVGIIGASNSYLELQNIRVMREVINNLNRTINFETANMTKSFETSIRHIKSIEKIRDSSSESLLTNEELELSKVRMKYPDYTLKEIADILEIPKSTAYARMRRIEEKADSIPDEEIEIEEESNIDNLNNEE